MNIFSFIFFSLFISIFVAIFSGRADLTFLLLPALASLFLWDSPSSPGDET